METTIMGLHRGYIRYIRLYMGLYWENGRENGNYYSILGLHWGHGKENGNYFSLNPEP